MVPPKDGFAPKAINMLKGANTFKGAKITKLVPRSKNVASATNHLLDN
jgi:hypothetical protein